MSKYRYREVKNYIHNELKLTKEDIKDIIVSIVKEEVKHIFHNTYGDDVNIERWIRCMVSDEIKKNGDFLMIRNLCREIIKEEIVDRLSIDISLKRRRNNYGIYNTVFYTQKYTGTSERAGRIGVFTW